ncbi:MAG: alanine racemase [Ruminococcaceae bacterium]|nr:alanine racemase [Oscillospiraceae bacterium]
MSNALKRTWAEIDLDALSHNYKIIRDKIGKGIKFLGVVKADAYGHGSLKISQKLEELGADYLAVSNLEEAIELRNGGIKMPILLLGHTPADQIPQIIEYSITQAVSCENKALEYEAEAAKLGKTVKVHIKLDTGMSRLGFLCSKDHFERGLDAVIRSVALPHLDTEGIFTHFSSSDTDEDEDISYTNEQLELFKRFIGEAEKRGVSFKIKHCANSGAVANYPESYMDMVRPGILLYGYGEYANKLGLIPVMSLKTVISTIKYYDAETAISYGRTFVTDKKTRIAVLPIGYADGFFRCLSDKYCLASKYGKSPIRGRICMDMCMIDISNMPELDVGDEICVFGKENPIEDMATMAGTIPYEICCSISKRVPRIFIANGKEISRETGLRI